MSSKKPVDPRKKWASTSAPGGRVRITTPFNFASPKYQTWGQGPSPQYNMWPPQHPYSAYAPVQALSASRAAVPWAAELFEGNEEEEEEDDEEDVDLAEEDVFQPARKRKAPTAAAAAAASSSSSSGRRPSRGSGKKVTKRYPTPGRPSKQMIAEREAAEAAQAAGRVDTRSFKSMVDAYPPLFAGPDEVAFLQKKECTSCQIYVGRVILKPCGHGKYCFSCINRMKTEALKMARPSKCLSSICYQLISGWQQLFNVSG